jgi:hypothetical protein
MMSSRGLLRTPIAQTALLRVIRLPREQRMTPIAGGDWRN